MDKDAVVAAINCLKDRLVEDGIRVSKIVLYGSRTRGDEQEESDIDLLVVSDDFRDRDIFERAAITKDAEVAAMKKFQVPFDIITLTCDEFHHGGSLFTQFAEDGETVYEEEQ